MYKSLKFAWINISFETFPISYGSIDQLANGNDNNLLCDAFYAVYV